MKIYKNVSDSLLKLKIPLIITFDSLIIIFNFLILNLLLSYQEHSQFLKYSITIYIIFFFLFSNHKNLNRYFNEKNIIKILLTLIFSNIITYLILFKSINIEISFGILLFFMNCISIITLRYIIFYSLIKFHKIKQKNKIIIYGIEANAYYLKNIIDSFEGYTCIGFIDPKSSKKYNNLAGKKIFELKKMNNLIFNNKIEINGILNSTNESIEDLLVDKYTLSKNKIDIFDDIYDFFEKVTKNNLNYIFPNIPKIENELINEIRSYNNEFQNKTILITGAAGSIGKNLTTQILSLNPKCLILLDHNEFGLYELENLILSKLNNSTEIHYELLNLSNEESVNYLFKKHNIDFIYHSAAYKHVNIVEKNFYSTFLNNFLSTKYLVENSIKNNVSKFLLVSTDKSVNPTNFMGATKRLCELFIYENFMNKSIDIDFYIVRFGNVINSSGSVLPLFDRQIKSGGPVTITDKNTTRFFMSINQATSLIILSSIMKYETCYYILDMGKPLNIDDIAKKMINHYEKAYETFYKKLNIKIEYIGLSKGEKLHEELSYAQNLKKTKNKYILTTKEITSHKIDFNEIVDIFASSLNFDPKNFINYLKDKSDDFKFLE